MDWSNERVLEFIELLEEEPAIWNSKSKSHRNRKLVNAAWIRITSKLTIPCTIEELKKKRNTLLTQYRECLRKIKESTKVGSSAEEIYRPSWFAFDALHNYMGRIYDCRLAISTENQERKSRSPLSHEEAQYLEDPLSHDSNNERPMSRESNSQSEPEPYYISKRRCGVKDLLSEKKENDEAFLLINDGCKENDNGSNVCDLYGQLLAQKLKTLSDDDRLILMNEIDNTVFNYMIGVRRRSSSVRTEYKPSTN